MHWMKIILVLEDILWLLQERIQSCSNMHKPYKATIRDIWQHQSE